MLQPGASDEQPPNADPERHWKLPVELVLHASWVQSAAALHWMSHAQAPVQFMLRQAFWPVQPNSQRPSEHTVPPRHEP